MTSRQTDRVETADLQWCHDAVHDVSRTFSITVSRLDDPMATDICLGYLLCRVADTIEDASHISPRTQTDLLTTYDRALDPTDDTSVEEFAADAEPWIPDEGSPSYSADWRVVANAPRIVRTFETLDPERRELVREPTRELVGGMATFADRYADEGGLRLQTLPELEEYCWYVAGTVGTLVTDLLSRDLEEARTQELTANARSFALLLQLVNVAKDVRADYREENNVYLPAEWLADEGVEPDAVTEDANREAVIAVVRRVTDQAATYLDDAQRYLEVLPVSHGNTLSAWAIPYFLAVGTIRELRARPEDVLIEGDVKVERSEVYALLQRFEDGVERSELGALRSTIANQPLDTLE